MGPLVRFRCKPAGAVRRFSLRPCRGWLLKGLSPWVRFAADRPGANNVGAAGQVLRPDADQVQRNILFVII